MLYLSQLRPDVTRTGEFLAGLWQGAVPPSLTLLKWLYVEGSPRSMLLLWEGDDAAAAYVQRVFGGVGVLTTEALTDATEGLALCFARDLDGFGEWLRGRDVDESEIVHQLDVRRRGRDAPTPEAASVAGRAWDLGDSDT